LPGSQRSVPRSCEWGPGDPQLSVGPRATYRVLQHNM